MTPFYFTVDESHIVVQALRLNTMSKLTFADCTRFDALVRDIFPGVTFKDVEYIELSAALHEVFEEAYLEIIPNQVSINATGRPKHLLAIFCTFLNRIIHSYFSMWKVVE